MGQSPQHAAQTEHRAIHKSSDWGTVRDWAPKPPGGRHGTGSPDSLLASDGHDQHQVKPLLRGEWRRGNWEDAVCHRIGPEPRGAEFRSASLRLIPVGFQAQRNRLVITGVVLARNDEEANIVEWLRSLMPVHRRLDVAQRIDGFVFQY